MGLGIIQALAAVLASDDAVARFQQAVVTAYKPIASFLIGNFDQAADGSLTLLRNLTTRNVTVAGSQTVTGPQVVTGSSTLNGPLAIVGTNGVTNFGVAQDGTANGTGTWSASSFVSAQGFKSVLFVGQATNSGANAGTQVQTGNTSFNQAMLGAAAFSFYSWPPTHSGSIVGLGLTEYGSNVGSHVVYVYRNGAPVFSWTAGVVVSAVQKTVAYPKNSANLTFSAGDQLKFYVSSSTANNINAQVHITIELGA